MKDPLDVVSLAVGNTFGLEYQSSGNDWLLNMRGTLSAQQPFLMEDYRPFNPVLAPYLAFGERDSEFAFGYGGAFAMKSGYAGDAWIFTPLVAHERILADSEDTSATTVALHLHFFGDVGAQGGLQFTSGHRWTTSSLDPSQDGAILDIRWYAINGCYWFGGGYSDDVGKRYLQGGLFFSGSGGEGDKLGGISNIGVEIGKEEGASFSRIQMSMIF